MNSIHSCQGSVIFLVILISHLRSTVKIVKIKLQLNYFDCIKDNVAESIFMKSLIYLLAASIRLCMGSRRGFICRMRMGNVDAGSMNSNHTLRARQRNTLGPSPDGNQYTVVHVTGYIKNWPPSGKCC